MRLSTEPFTALRTWLIAVFVVFLFSIRAVAKAFTGGPNEALMNQWLGSASMAIIASLAIAIVVSERVRDWLLDPNRRDRYEPTPFVLIAIFTSFMTAYYLWIRA